MKNLLIYGINPVSEALRSDRCRIKELWVAQGREPKGLEGIIGMAESKRVPMRRVERSQLDSLTKNASHQGVVGSIDHFNYADLDEVLQRGTGEPFLLVLDGIEDPRNLGALIRTAGACGVWGVIIPKDRAVGITPAVAKSSAGAVFHTPLIRVTNISSTLRRIKERGIWVIGAAAEAQTDLFHHDLAIPKCILVFFPVYGDSGRGITKRLK